MDKLIVTITGIGLIVAIYWFFFGAREETATIEKKATIIVKGGYKPKSIKVHAGQPVTLTFVRKDTNPCLEEIVIPDFKIKEYLPLNTPIEISLTIPRPGIHDMHCGMNMYHGSIQAI